MWPLFDSSNGYNSPDNPDAINGAGSVPFANISTIGRIGANSTNAQNLLGDLSGSLSGWEQSSTGGKRILRTFPVRRTDATGASTNTADSL